jgi:3-oxoacyl-[acyl-carrier-protein] synthase III
MPNSIITGTGSYIPSKKVNNRHFLKNIFYDANGNRISESNEEIIQKFQEITCIEERRYLDDSLVSSDMAYEAAKEALEGVDRESLDYIIVAHNFGDVVSGRARSDICPSLASRVKHKLGIENPFTVVYDILFGCPGWLHGVGIANYYIKSGEAKKVLVIGVEALSRVVDVHDRDSMIYADGAGAVLIEATEEKDSGILSHVSRSDTKKEAHLLWTGETYNPNSKGDEIYLKMHGHQIYKYALTAVPETIRLSLDKAGLTLNDVKKVLLHQANEKMDRAMLKKLFKDCRVKEIPKHIMPMTISWLGNSSVATLPTMFDLLQRGKLNNHKLNSGDIAVFASIGAGMNINSMVYRMP